MIFDKYGLDYVWKFTIKIKKFSQKKEENKIIYPVNWICVIKLTVVVFKSLLAVLNIIFYILKLGYILTPNFSNSLVFLILLVIGLTLSFKR